MPIKITCIEEDMGLWVVRAGDFTVGAIFDGGAKISGWKCDHYTIYDGWHNWEPDRKLGVATYFQTALAILRKRAKEICPSK